MEKFQAVKQAFVKDGQYIRKPYVLAGVPVWQGCYLCGVSIVFARQRGEWLGIGDGRIRHKRCEPPPLQ